MSNIKVYVKWYFEKESDVFSVYNLMLVLNLYLYKVW